MILCISPAKNLDFEGPHPRVKATRPLLREDSERLAARLASMKPSEIKRLMHLSDSLTRLNVSRYAAWSGSPADSSTRPCLFAFHGEVYRGLDAPTLDGEDLKFAQAHLRILSGLYGLLRPFDLIRPYRLEMGTKLAIGEHRNLYSFWGERIAGLLNRAVRSSGSRVLVNLASEEYFKAVDPARLEAPVVQPVFKDRRNGHYSVFFVYAKRARGLMCRYAVRHRVEDVEGLKGFDLAGYRFNQELSSGGQMVFTRERQP